MRTRAKPIPAFEKSRLRRELEARRRGLPASELAWAAEAVAETLCGHPAWQRARRIALYAPLPGELSTRVLAARAGAEARTPLWPRLAAGGGLEFAACDADALAPGPAGFPAPPAECRSRTLEVGDLVVLPCLGFDARGVRLGRGGGHYDRSFPPGEPAPLLVGLAFACQERSRLPEAPHDRRLDLVVTERGLRRPGC